jgi:hypothetical protein
MIRNFEKSRTTTIEVDDSEKSRAKFRYQEAQWTAIPGGHWVPIARSTTKCSRENLPICDAANNGGIQPYFIRRYN